MFAGRILNISVAYNLQLHFFPNWMIIKIDFFFRLKIMENRKAYNLPRSTKTAIKIIFVIHFVRCSMFENFLFFNSDTNTFDYFPFLLSLTHTIFPFFFLAQDISFSLRDNTHTQYNDNDPLN